MPADIVNKQAAHYTKKGVARERSDMVNDDDFTIIANYQSVYRGIVQYYLLAQNVCWLGRLRWIMATSLLKTLAEKHKSTVTQEASKLSRDVDTTDGLRKCFETRVERAGKKPLVARFGGIPLKRDKKAILVDRDISPNRTEGTELIKKLLAQECALCGSTTNIEVHHIRKLSDLDQPGRKEKPRWAKVMSNRRRKTLVLCRECHDPIDHGLPLRRQKNKE